MVTMRTKTKEKEPDFRVPFEWQDALAKDQKLLDYHLNMAIKMRDDVIERAIKLTERGYKFLELMILIATILSAVTLSASSNIIKFGAVGIIAGFLIVCIISFFQLKQNKILYKGFMPERALNKDIYDWIAREYKETDTGNAIMSVGLSAFIAREYKETDTRLYELEAINSDIREGVVLNEIKAKRLKVIQICLLILLALILILTAVCTIF